VGGGGSGGLPVWASAAATADGGVRRTAGVDVGEAIRGGSNGSAVVGCSVAAAAGGGPASYRYPKFQP
jgi:hypothetical protein